MHCYNRFTFASARLSCFTLVLELLHWLDSLSQYGMYLSVFKMNQFNTDIPQSLSNRIILGFRTRLYLIAITRHTQENIQYSQG